MKLRHSGKWCEKGKVLQYILKQYSATLKTLAEEVRTKEEIRNQLVNIARSIERKDTTKIFLLENHQSYFKRIATRAVSEIKSYLKDVKEARELLKLYEDLQDFNRNDMVGRREGDLKRAEKAKARLINLIADLKENLND